jgi:hypothetical protein
MDSQVKTSLREWMNAKKLVSQNPALLSESPDNSAECKKRLSLLESAELKLKSLKNQTNLPAELVAWINSPSPECDCQLNHLKQHRACILQKRMQIAAEIRLKNYIEHKMPPR